MTEVVAVTVETAVVEKGIRMHGLAETAVKCNAGLLRGRSLDNIDMHTVSQVNDASLLANIVLHLNLLTSTIQSAQVESVLVSFKNMTTTCVGKKSLSAIGCDTLSREMSPFVRKILEGPVSAHAKEVLQSTLDSKLPVGPGQMMTSSGAEKYQLELDPVDKPEPNLTPTSVWLAVQYHTWALALGLFVPLLTGLLILWYAFCGTEKIRTRTMSAMSAESDLVSVRVRSISTESSCAEYE